MHIPGQVNIRGRKFPVGYIVIHTHTDIPVRSWTEADTAADLGTVYPVFCSGKSVSCIKTPWTT